MHGTAAGVGTGEHLQSLGQQRLCWLTVPFSNDTWILGLKFQLRPNKLESLQINAGSK